MVQSVSGKQMDRKDFTATSPSKIHARSLSSLFTKMVIVGAA